MGLLAELRQRKLVQWTLAYVAAAFALLQGVDFVAQRFGWPEWIGRALIILGGIGFFVTLLLAWYHGERGAQRVSGTELLLLALLLTIGGGLLWRFGLSTPTPVAPGAATTAHPAPVADAKSIAVLAFADLSPGKDHEYLSDGIAEEVLNALTRVRGLKVAGRTSAFHYKGKNEDLREIGRALGVAHVLEGSVRTQDEQVRITAQLIRTADGFHLWSENYEGRLTDVFALEDRIARAIVRELDVVLQGEDSARMVEAATTSAEAYTLYLRALGVVNRRELALLPEARGWLERATTLDPNFARAWALLANLSGLDYRLDQAGTAARRALELDPRQAQAHAALSRVHFFSWPPDSLGARDEMERALELDPDDADINFRYAQTLIQDGYLKAGRARLDRTLSIDPLLPNALFWRGQELAAEGRYDEAERDYERAAQEGLSWVSFGPFNLARKRGDYERAKALFPSVQRLHEPCGGVNASDLPEAILMGRPGTATERTAAQATIERCLASKPERLPYWVVIYLVQVGEYERALIAMRTLQGTNRSGERFVMWTAPAGTIRAIPAFADYARAMGMIEVWEKYGAPDGCERVAPGEYRCE